MKHLEATTIPKGFLFKHLLRLWCNFLHLIVGCEPFFFYRNFRNNKSYMRTCTCCGKREKKVSGKWRLTK